MLEQFNPDSEFKLASSQLRVSSTTSSGGDYGDLLK
jgi:hypothetical protein